MDGILELREFVPEPKYVETNELDRPQELREAPAKVRPHHQGDPVQRPEHHLVLRLDVHQTRQLKSRRRHARIQRRNEQHTAVGAARAKNSRLEQASVRGLGQSPRQLNSRQAHRKRHETKSRAAERGQIARLLLPKEPQCGQHHLFVCACRPDLHR